MLRFFRKPQAPAVKEFSIEDIRIAREKVGERYQAISEDPYMDDAAKRAAWNSTLHTYLEGFSRWIKSLWDR